MNIQAIKRKCVSRRMGGTSSDSAEGAATFPKGEGFGEA